jgi:hypothetical protein
VDRPEEGPGDSLLLSELIERNGGLDWREAVSIVHELCVALRDTPSQAVLLEPRNIEVTANGQIRLLPGQSSSEAQVVQLGRLLRAMLLGRAVPPDLRLLLSQATFEVPILHSIEEVDRKLREFCHLDDGDGLRAAFARAISPDSPSPAPASSEAPAEGRPILPLPAKRRRLLLAREYWRTDAVPRDGLLLASLLVGLAVLAGLTLGRSAPSPNPTAAATGPPAAAEVATGSSGTSAEALPSPPPRAAAPAATPSKTAPPPVEAARDRERPMRADAPPRRERAGNRDPDAVAAPPPPPSATAVRETERRAEALIAGGQSIEAAMAFDALVMSNPLYEPKRYQLTPEAYTAFEASRRALLPTIAQREHDRARTAMTAGNHERALASGNLALAILDRIEAPQLEGLREQTTELIQEATLAKLSAEEIIYGPGSQGVVPPRPLSRQFPLSGPVEVPPHRIGTLEMIIGKAGDVEFVKLHTPLNRYHERMVVSAAKAWRYTPATKAGKPVRFRVTVRINLPESGTDPF